MICTVWARLEVAFIKVEPTVPRREEEEEGFKA